MIKIQDKALGYAIEVSRPGESGEFIAKRAKKFYAFMTMPEGAAEIGVGTFALSRAVAAQMRGVSLSLSTTPDELTEEVLKRARAFLVFFDGEA